MPVGAYYKILLPQAEQMAECTFLLISTFCKESSGFPELFSLNQPRGFLLAILGHVQSARAASRESLVEVESINPVQRFHSY